MSQTRSSSSNDAQNIAQTKPYNINDIFSIPRPIKGLFDSVPLYTYPPNQLPARSPKPDSIPSLYIFGNQRDCLAGRPSFNPTCLRWQAFLRVNGIKHKLISSNNHASPTGSLPFLITSTSSPQPRSNTPQPQIIPTTKLPEYINAHTFNPSSSSNSDPRLEPYQSLLDKQIRLAWLHTLYLTPTNFTSTALPLYIEPITTSPLLHLILSHQLRQAAQGELLKWHDKIDVDDLYAEADAAWEALSLLLSGDEWFFASEMPGWLDVSVFAYTWLLCGEGGALGFRERRLGRGVLMRENLVGHARRLFERYWGEEV